MEGKTKQLNVRIPIITQNQIRDIEEQTGMTQTQTVIVAIDRLATGVKPGEKRKGL